jgi:hypothetical protein
MLNYSSMRPHATPTPCHEAGAADLQHSSGAVLSVSLLAPDKPHVVIRRPRLHTQGRIWCVFVCCM